MFLDNNTPADECKPRDTDQTCSYNTNVFKRLRRLFTDVYKTCGINLFDRLDNNQDNWIFANYFLDIPRKPQDDMFIANYLLNQIHPIAYLHPKIIDFREEFEYLKYIENNPQEPSHKLIEISGPGTENLKTLKKDYVPAYVRLQTKFEPSLKDRIPSYAQKLQTDFEQKIQKIRELTAQYTITNYTPEVILNIAKTVANAIDLYYQEHALNKDTGELNNDLINIDYFLDNLNSLAISHKYISVTNMPIVPQIPKKLGKIARLAKTITPERLKDPQFWKQNLMRHQRQGQDILNMYLGNIHAARQPYTCNANIWNRKQQNEQNEQFLQDYVVTREDGEISIPLEDIAPTVEKRFAKKCKELHALQQLAEEDGMSGLFITLTLPGEYHANPEYKQTDHEWNGTLPKEAMNNLGSKWKKVQDRLQRNEIPYLFCKVPEPHKDGCPHLHILLYALLEDIATVEQLFIDQIENENSYIIIKQNFKYKKGYELTIKEFNNSQQEKDNPNKCKPANYMLKYLKKTIINEEADNIATCVDAWRSTWSIYSITIGGSRIVNGSFGRYQKFNRMHERPAEPGDPNDITWRLWLLARSGNLLEFIKLERIQTNIKPITRQEQEPDTEPKRNRYGETVTEYIGHLYNGTKQIIWKLHSWKIELRKEEKTASNQQPVEIVTKSPRKEKPPGSIPDFNNILRPEMA